MLSFVNDYSAGAHPKVLESLIKTNMVKTPGYGEDEYCAAAKEKIKAACLCPQAQIFFISGGTQTNQLILDSILKRYEGVIAADTSHINTHEAGAIEFTGHKVLTLENSDGKISANRIETYAEDFYADGNHEHMVPPGAVYISHPTEYGTLYSLKELKEIRRVCDKYNLKLFLDGARLGCALACKTTDVTLPDIAKLTDVFYIGGTKCGALYGEAVVFTKNNMPVDFVTTVKQHGALMAKGRLLGVQFDALFTDNLYWDIGAHANRLADRVKQALKNKGYELYVDSPTNQIFVIVDKEQMEYFSQNVKFSFFQRLDERRTVIRFVTDWATVDNDVDKLIEIINR